MTVSLGGVTIVSLAEVPRRISILSRFASAQRPSEAASDFGLDTTRTCHSVTRPRRGCPSCLVQSPIPTSASHDN